MALVLAVLLHMIGENGVLTILYSVSSLHLFSKNIKARVFFLSFFFLNFILFFEKWVICVKYLLVTIYVVIQSRRR